MGWVSRGVWVLFLWTVAFLLFVLALGLLPPERAQGWLSQIYESAKLRLGLGAFAVAALFGGVFLLRWAVREMQRQRTIAFPNPDGEVTVSLEAIEEFVRQLGMEQEGIQEVKASASASGEGILIQLRAALWSSCQIPETTERLQSRIRAHVHDMLGVEGPVTVHVHVGKVVRAPKTEALFDASQKVFTEKIQP